MRPDRRLILRLATFFYLLAAVIAVLWSALFGQPDRLLGEARPTAGALLHGLWVGLAIVALCHLGYRYAAWVRRASRAMGAFLGPLGAGDAIYLALLSGFVEELLFRGALWPQLGLVGTSILFGLLHTVPVRALATYPLFAAAVGLAFGWLRESSGSVWPCIVAHATINGLNLAFLGAEERKSSRETTHVDEV